MKRGCFVLAMNSEQIAAFRTLATTACKTTKNPAPTVAAQSVRNVPRRIRALRTVIVFPKIRVFLGSADRKHVQTICMTEPKRTLTVEATASPVLQAKRVRTKVIAQRICLAPITLERTSATAILASMVSLTVQRLG